MPNLNIVAPTVSIKGVKDASGIRLTKGIKPVLKNIPIKDGVSDPYKTLKNAIKEQVEGIGAFSIVKKYSVDAIRLGTKSGGNKVKSNFKGLKGKSLEEIYSAITGESSFPQGKKVVLIKGVTINVSIEEFIEPGKQNQKPGGGIYTQAEKFVAGLSGKALKYDTNLPAITPDEIDKFNENSIECPHCHNRFVAG